MKSIAIARSYVIAAHLPLYSCTVTIESNISPSLIEMADYWIQTARNALQARLELCFADFKYDFQPR
jgi:hypothetical protein